MSLPRRLSLHFVAATYHSSSFILFPGFIVLTLPVVILRSAVDTMVDTVLPLTSAVKVACKEVRKINSCILTPRNEHDVNKHARYLCAVINKSINDLSGTVEQGQELVGSLYWGTGTGIVLLPGNRYGC